MSGTTREELLKARARELARPLSAPTEDTAEDVVIVALGSTRVAVPLRYVVEIVRAQGLTPLPGAEPPAVAVLGWRGRILTVLDLAGRALPAVGDSRGGSRYVVVLGERRAVLGVVVDGIETVVPLRLDRLHPAPPGTEAAHPWVAGVTDDGVVVAEVRAIIGGYGQTP